MLSLCYYFDIALKGEGGQGGSIGGGGGVGGVGGFKTLFLTVVQSSDYNNGGDGPSNDVPRPVVLGG